jgi:hypothetical protein
MPAGGQEPGTFAEEAVAFGRYLTGQSPGQQCIDLYVAAVVKRAGIVSGGDARLISFARRHPHALGLLDAGLALARPRAELRRRIYLMFAIVEATPENCQSFLPTDRSRAYIVVVAAYLAAAMLKAILGLALIGVVARR